MNTASTLLHDMRSQQLRALSKIQNGSHGMNCGDYMRIRELVIKTEGSFDISDFSDNLMEEIDTLSGKYFYRVR